MQRLCLILLIIALAVTVPTEAGDSATRTRLIRLDLSGALPLEFGPIGPGAHWDLTGVPTTEAGYRIARFASSSVTMQDDGRAETVWTSSGASTDLTAWMSPERLPESLVVGATRDLKLVRTVEGRDQSLDIRLETVAEGQLQLRSGTRQVVLQQAWVNSDGGSGRMVLRWVEPDAGTLVEIWGTGTADGSALTSVDEAWLSEGILAAADLKLYVDQVQGPLSTSLTLGWDLGADVPVASVIANNEGVTTMGDLVALDYWDFSQSIGGVEVAQTMIPLAVGETCNLGQCGYDLNDSFGRQDRNFDAPDPVDRVTNNQVVEREDRAADVTIWLRATTLKEGVTGCFGDGESRICHDVADGRPEVPLWQFTHQDADGWFVQVGDSWSSDPFQCDQTVFNTVCGADPPGICLTPGEMWARDCSDKAGNQVGDVLKGGVVSLPSGHTLNTLLIRTVTEFCAYSGDACFLPLQQIRVVVHFWQIPWAGPAALLQTDISAPDTTTFTTLAESNIAFGLFPPLSTAVEATTADSIEISWTPGRDTRRIDDYKIYWDTDSGADSDYAFNSVANSGQVAFSGDSATISGLAGGTTYHFAVVARYGHPRVCEGGNVGQRCVADGECGGGTCTGSETIYESILFPKQIEGDPGFVYPVEVQATTSGGTCTPTEEVTNVTVDLVNGGIQICWDPSSDPCLGAYDVSGAVSPESAAGFGQLAQTGRTCWAGDPGDSYYLVRTRGTGGSGPLGHYGD